MATPPGRLCGSVLAHGHLRDRRTRLGAPVHRPQTRVSGLGGRDAATGWRTSPMQAASGRSGPATAQKRSRDASATNRSVWSRSSWRRTVAWCGGATPPATSREPGLRSTRTRATLRCPCSRGFPRGGARGSRSPARPSLWASAPTRTIACTCRTATGRRALLHAAAYPSGVGRNDVAASRRAVVRRLPRVHPAAEHGDLTHQELRVLDATDGSVVGELVDTGSQVDPVAWSPATGRPTTAVHLGDRAVRATGGVGPGHGRPPRPGGGSGRGGDPPQLVARRRIDPRSPGARRTGPRWCAWPERRHGDPVADTGGEIPERGGASRRRGLAPHQRQRSPMARRRPRMEDRCWIPPASRPRRGGRTGRIGFAQPARAVDPGVRGDAAEGEGPFPAVMSVHGGPNGTTATSSSPRPRRSSTPGTRSRS